MWYKKGFFEARGAHNGYGRKKWTQRAQFKLCVTHHVNDIEKGMNPSFLSPADKDL